MYDHIELHYESESHQYIDFLVNRFSLFAVNTNKSTFLHNHRNDTLIQNLGLYIKIEDTKMKNTKKIIVRFSLHKFYNTNCNKRLFNYNVFSFKEATQAAANLKTVLKHDLSCAKVKGYEIGLNIQLLDTAFNLMSQLRYFNGIKEIIRIVWDRRLKLYTLFGTESTPDKRVVLVFYDKTHEVKSSTDNPQTLLEVPKNLLRIELKQKRVEKIYFNDLFSADFIKICKAKFKGYFVDNLIFERYFVPDAFFNSTDKKIIYEDFELFGSQYVIDKNNDTFFDNNISARTKQRRAAFITQMIEEKKSPIYNIKDIERDFKVLVTNTLKNF